VPERASRWGCLAGALLALAAGPAAAAVFVVDTNMDGSGGSCPAGPSALPGGPGTCSLRDAITAANASAGDDLILFAPAVFSDAASRVITLGSPLPAIDDDLEINAVSSPLLTTRVQGIVVRAGAGVVSLFAVSDGTSQLDDVALEDAGVTVDTGARLVFSQTVDVTYAEAISGGGALEKRGAARLVLTGTNTYTGDTAVAEGALQGDTLSIVGDVDDDALLVFDQEMGDPEDFMGAISGTGRLEKIGAGTLFLRTANSYGGGTTVGAGTLAGFAGSGGMNGSLQGDIQNDAVLRFEQVLGADGTFAGDITGSGRLEKTGEGALVLTGSNSYAGGTTISAGILRGAAGAIQGDVEIGSAMGSGAKLLFDQPGAGTFSGDITGGGSLPVTEFSVEKLGAGTLTLTGTNSYVGGTRVNAGTLRGDTLSLQGDITLASGTSLVFDQSFAGAFTGLLVGDGALEKRGTGTVVLTQDLAGGLGFFDGSTTIAGGRLEVATGAVLPGDVSILSGGALGGTGMVNGLVTANAGGAISPGDSIGTLTVGDATFRTGSFLEVEVTPAPPADRLNVMGTATIDPGAQVRVIPAPGDYPDPGLGTPAVILDAGTKLGDFEPIPAGTFAFLDVTLEQDANQVLLTVESNGNTLVDVAATPNQLAVAEALETAEAGGEPDVGTVFGELNTLSAAGVQDALDAMAGEQLTQFATARLAVGQRFHASIQERIRGAGGDERSALFARAGARSLAATPLGLIQGAALPAGALAAAGLAMQQGVPGHDPEPEPLGLGGWLDGYGSFGDVSAGSGTDGFDTTIWGVSAGLDFRPAAGLVVGAAGGWARSQLDFDSLDGRPEADTAQGAAYLGYTSPLVEAGGAFRFGWSRMSAERGIDFAPPSTLSRSADSEFDGIDLGGHVEAALNLFELGGVSVQPLAAFTYAHLQQDAFDESGADSLDLSADEATIDSAVSGLGARLHARIQLDEETWLRPELRARWLHEFGDVERKLDARIGGIPGAAFTVRGTELPRDAASVGMGWTVVTFERLLFFAEYDLAVNPDLLQHTVALGLEVVW
jgi:outer membrane autotransporter protein/CSLREA domain-containing protein